MDKIKRKRFEVDWSGEYNSSKEDIIISEYGRNVQNLVAHAKTIANPQERQAFSERVIWLMMQISPQSRNVEDYQEKLWKHIFRIANYELEVTPPDGIEVKPEDARKHPDKVPYPESQVRFRHYGHNVQRLINEALQMPEGPKRDGFVAAIGAYMKLAYKTWNREHYVSDEVIKSDLAAMSDGQIILDEEMSLDNLGGAPNNNNNNNNNNKRRNNNYNKQQQRSAYPQNSYNQRNNNNNRMRQQQSSRRNKK